MGPEVTAQSGHLLLRGKGRRCYRRNRIEKFGTGQMAAHSSVQDTSSSEDVSLIRRFTRSEYAPVYIATGCLQPMRSMVGSSFRIPALCKLISCRL